MKLLLDENLSRRLVTRLSDLFPSSEHVSALGLLNASDLRIWEYARTNDFTIVTADADFYELAITFGPPPKVIWLRRCDYPTRAAENLLRTNAIRVTEFLRDPDQGVLPLEP